MKKITILFLFIFSSVITYSQDFEFDFLPSSLNEEVLDNELIKKSLAAIHERLPVRFSMEIENIDRAFGTMLSHEVSKANGESGLPDGTIHIDVVGSAGQSLGAWLAPGVTIELSGDANDYVG